MCRCWLAGRRWQVSCQQATTLVAVGRGRQRLRDDRGQNQQISSHEAVLIEVVRRAEHRIDARGSPAVRTLIVGHDGSV